MAPDDDRCRWVNNPVLLDRWLKEQRAANWRGRVLDMVEHSNPKEVPDLDPDLRRLVEETRKKRIEFDSCLARFIEVLSGITPKEDK